MSCSESNCETPLRTHCQRFYSRYLVQYRPMMIGSVSNCLSLVSPKEARTGMPTAAVRTATPATAVAPIRLLAFRFEEAAFDRWHVFLGLFVATLLVPIGTRFVADGVAWVVAGGHLRSFLSGEANTLLRADAPALPGYAW